MDIFVAVIFVTGLCPMLGIYANAITPTAEIVVPEELKENDTHAIKCKLTINSTKHHRVRFFIDGNAKHAYNLSRTQNPIFPITSIDELNVSRTDNGKQIHCCVRCDECKKPTCSDTSTLNVLFPSTYFSLEEIPTPDNTDKVHDLSLRCAVGDSNPASTIKWIGLVNTMKTTTTAYKNMNNKTNSEVVIEELFMNLTRQDIGCTIYCEAKNSEWPDKYLSYRINVTLEPNITIDGGSVRMVQKGSNVFIRCTVDSNPDSRITWHNTSGVIKESQGSYLDIELLGVSTLQNGSLLTCTAENDGGAGINKSVTLIVTGTDSNTDINHSAKSLHSFLNIRPLLGGIIIVINILVIIVIVSIYISCKRKKNERRCNNAQGEGQNNEDSEEVTADTDVVVYARVNKRCVPPVGNPRCDNAETTASTTPSARPVVEGDIIELNALPTPPIGAVKDRDNEAVNVQPRVDQHSLTKFNDDDEENSRVHYENVVSGEFDSSLTERNLLPPPYITETIAEEIEPDNNYARSRKGPTSLVYVDVEFPNCPKETDRVIGDDRTLYSSVLFESTPHYESIDKKENS